MHGITCEINKISLAAEIILFYFISDVTS